MCECDFRGWSNIHTYYIMYYITHKPELKQLFLETEENYSAEELETIFYQFYPILKYPEFDVDYMLVDWEDVAEGLKNIKYTIKATEIQKQLKIEKQKIATAS